jgi:hypothetical protein
VSSGKKTPSLRPLWIVALVAAVLATDEMVSRRQLGRFRNGEPNQGQLAMSAPADSAKAPCPSQTLPDHGVCIPVPKPEASAHDDVEATLALLPGRPDDYRRYISPIVGHIAAPGQDEGAIITAAIGTEVRSIRLESQSGATRWASLPGTVPVLLTLHRVQRGSSSRSYVLVHRGLEVNAPPAAWTDIADGSVLGRVSDALTPPGLRLRVRQLRRGAPAESAPTQRTLRDSHSLECDPRNVLPFTPS